MDYYQRKALVEALLNIVQPPTSLCGYFRVIKEVYAHKRFDLTLSLCEAIVLSRMTPGRDNCPLFSDESHAKHHCFANHTPSEHLALEAIHRALACACNKKTSSQTSLVWLRFRD